MRNDNLFAAMLIAMLTFVIGFFVGGQYEKNKFDHRVEGADWEIRWRNDVPPPPQAQPHDQNTRVRVWPWVDVETNP